MLRYSLFQILVLLFITSNVSAYEIHVDIDEAQKKVSFQNTYLSAELSYLNDLHISSFNSLKTDFLWRGASDAKSPEVRPGNFLVLFSQNPESATDTLDLPSAYKATKTVLDATTTEVSVESTSPTQISLSRKYVFTSNESMIRVTTQIRNESDRPITIYPSEISTFNTEFGASGKPNVNLGLMAPINPAAYQVIRSASPNNPFRLFKEEKVLLVHNRATLGEIKATGNGNWLAVQNGLQAGPICAIEYQYPDLKPEPISSNLRLLLNGIVTSADSRITAMPSMDFQKYMQVSQVLGKVIIEPSKTFTYKTIWSSAICNGPVINVQDGIIIKRPLYISYGGMGFYVFATLGVPQEGFIKIEFYNKSDELLKDNIPSLVTDYQAKVKRPAYSVPEFPAVLQHEIWFSEEKDPTTASSDNELVLKNTQMVRLSLLDLSLNFVRVLAESQGPWQEFAMPQQPEAVEIGLD